MPACDFIIGKEHPALAGHFPGNPIVPGVVILDHVLQCAAEAGLQVHAVANAKFLSPLQPDNRCSITFSESRTGIAFQVVTDDTLLVSGTLQYTQEA